MCKEQQVTAVSDAEAAASPQERIAAILAAQRENPFNFRSYDPAVTRWYFRRYPWVAVQMPVRICSHNTAMAQELARLLESVSSMSGSCNPTMIAKMLAELKALHFDSARITYYAFQVCIRSSALVQFDYADDMHAQNFTTDRFEQILVDCRHMQLGCLVQLPCT